uniref:G_PROTEIN_RECEP_F1_2 domain-containing protein n=1 Tax=Ascaris lumbricoides TaxID=6252 RepID=A0A0M3HJV3_ASCLU
MDDDDIVPPKGERTIIGSLFVAMDLAALIPLAAVIMAILMDKKMRRIQAYRIMLYIALLDFFELCAECAAGFITIWPIQNDLSTKVFMFLILNKF